MATVREYKQYAQECLRWAAEAKTEEDRKALLDLARDWTLAAMRLEGVIPPADKEANTPFRRTG
jgi:hypothetical protein